MPKKNIHVSGNERPTIFHDYINVADAREALIRIPKMLKAPSSVPERIIIVPSIEKVYRRRTNAQSKKNVELIN